MSIVDHSTQLQPNYYFCGPAATRVVFTTQNQYPSQYELANELHTTTNGTDSVAEVCRVLNNHGWQFAPVFIGGTSASPEQINALWLAVQHAVTSGFAIVANVVGSIRTLDGSSYNYPGGHYVAVVGFDASNSTVTVADVNVRDYQITVSQLGHWIAGRGYAAYIGENPNQKTSGSAGLSYENTISPIFGVDLSDFDSDRGNSPATVARYRAEGISFVTHKSVEVTPNQTFYHTRIAGMLTAAKDSGMPFIGAYIVPRTGVSAGTAADIHIAFLDQQIPWWRTFPGFFHQVDLERWPYDSVDSSAGIALYESLRAKTGQPVYLYASKGQYGSDSLTAPLWNARYGLNTPGEYRSLYDSVGGNNGLGWQPYGNPPLVPDIWQYGSKGVVAGQPTTDVNAFRGTEAQFASLLGIRITSNEEDEDMARPVQFVVQSRHDDPLGDGVGNAVVILTFREDGKIVKANIGNGSLIEPAMKALNQGGMVYVDTLVPYPDA